MINSQPMKLSDKQVRQARFFRKFLRLTRGRVDVVRSLETAAMEEKDDSFKTVILAMAKDMADGTTMSEAMKKWPAEFSPSVRELIRSAEKSGAWDEILEETAAGLEDGTFD